MGKELSGKWEMVKLGDVFKLSSGKGLAAKKRVNGEYNVYGGNGVTGCHNEYFVEESTIIIGRVGENCGATHLTTNKCWITDNALMVIKKIIDYDNKYMAYLLTYLNLNKYANTSGQPSISQNTVYDIKIHLPPLEMQKEIARNLDLASELVKLHKRKLEELDKLIQTVFYDMFGDPVTNEKGWEIDDLKSLCTKMGSGSTPRGGKESYKESGISLIRSMNVHNGYFKYKDLAFIDELQAKILDNVTINENDVLINITGASVARTCIVPSEILPARVNQHVSILRCKKEIMPIYLNVLLSSKIMQYMLLNIGTSNGATREAITKIQLESLKIIVPPLSFQQKFVEIITEIENQKIQVHKSLEDAEMLYSSLMQNYFD